MPYIKEDQRTQFEEAINNTPIPENAGELNYLLTSFVLDYLGTHPNYQKFCEVEGVLSHMSKEIYRRLAAPYEDKKIRENGDLTGFRC